jgi:tetratricopeptide (TPR) repeat protein
MRFDLRKLRFLFARTFGAGAIFTLTFATTVAQDTTPPTPPQGETASDATATPADAAQINPKEVSEKGEAALKAGDFQAALKAFSDLVTYGKTSPEANAQGAQIVGLTGMGRALAGLKENEAAMEALKNVIDNGGDQYQPALIARGQLYLETNQPDLALVDFQNAQKLDRNNMEATLGLGHALVLLSRPDEAILSLNKVIAADPNNAEALRYRGMANGSLYKTKPAIADLEKSISIDPENHETYAALGAFLLRDERHQEGVDQLAKAIEKFKPKAGQEDVPYIEGYLQQANGYVELGKNSKDEAARKAAYQKSIEVSEKLLDQLDDKNPLHARVVSAVLYSRGVGERLLGEYGKAIRSFSRAIELNPESAESYFRRGICFHILGEDKMAISDFEQAAHLSYDDPRANLWLGFAWSKDGDFHKAIRAYGDAIAASDRYAPAWYNRGLAYIALGDNEKALSDLNEAIRLDPTHADYYYKRGLLYEKMGDAKKASESYSTAIEFDGKHADAYKHMGAVMQSLGKADLAAEYTKKAEELSPPEKKK